MPNVPTETVQETWHIENCGGDHYPFRLVCTPFIGAPMAFRFKTLEEAHEAINRVAQEHDRMGYLLALA